MSFLWGKTDGADAPLVAGVSSNGAKPSTAFEIFIEGALTKIYNEAHGRTKDQRAVREACKSVLGETPLNLQRTAF